MSLAARYVWAYLPCHADREGLLRDSPFALKAAIMPADSVDMEGVLTELATRRHILRYVVEGRRFIQIRNFARYQFPHKNEKASPLPSPSEGRELVKLLEQHGSAPVIPGTAPPDPESGIRRSGPESGSGSGALATRPEIPDPPMSVKPWPAHRWLAKFKAAHDARPGAGGFYGDTGDTTACGRLTDELDRLPATVRAAAEEIAPQMFAAFFKNADKRTIARGLPFSFFVQEFGNLRAKATPVKPFVAPIRPPPLRSQRGR